MHAYEPRLAQGSASGPVGHEVSTTAWMLTRRKAMKGDSMTLTLPTCLISPSPSVFSYHFLRGLSTSSGRDRTYRGVLKRYDLHLTGGP
jgi:hypothetical protein